MDTPTTKVFVFYSRKDRAFVRRLVEGLETEDDIEVFRDTEDILPTEEWIQWLEELIGEADTIAFVLSPNSAKSDVCRWEVDHAESLNKRIATICCNLHWNTSPVKCQLNRMKNKSPYLVRLFSIMLVVLLAVCITAKESRSEEDEETDTRDVLVSHMCRQLKEQADKWNIPPAYFAKLIWKESWFDSNAISPKGAEGIAQFMPGTARRRGLEDPFDPDSAIAASAKYLSELRDEFGNLGLAAAAYNAGENRVYRWRAGRSGLPRETQDYVYSITGYKAREWKREALSEARFVLDEVLSFEDACNQLAVIRAPLQRYFANTYYNRGLALSQKKEYRKAVARYTVAVRLKRIFPHAYNNRGLVYRKMGDYENAIANYDAAIKQRPSYAVAYNNRGYAKRKLGRLKQAIEDYDKAIKLKSGYIAAFFNRGFAKAKLGRLKEAIIDYGKAIRLKPDHVLALYNRALAHLESGSAKLARADFSKAIVVNPGFAKAYYRRAILLNGLGKTKLALKDYKKSVALNAAFGRTRYKKRFQAAR